MTESTVLSARSWRAVRWPRGCRRVLARPRARPPRRRAVGRGRENRARRRRADADDRGGIPAVSGNRRARQGRRLPRRRSAWTSAIASAPASCSRCSRFRNCRTSCSRTRPRSSERRRKSNRAQADLDARQSAHDVAHLGADAAGRRDEAAAESGRAAGHRRGARARSRRRGAGRHGQGRRRGRAASSSRSRGPTQNKTTTLFAYSRITAPFAGVITHRYADTGAMIQAGTSSQTQAMPLVRLSQNSRAAAGHSGSGIGGVAHSRRRAGRRGGAGAAADFTGTVARFADKLDPDTRTMRRRSRCAEPDAGTGAGHVCLRVDRRSTGRRTC